MMGTRKIHEFIAQNFHTSSGDEQSLIYDFTIFVKKLCELLNVRLDKIEVNQAGADVTIEGVRCEYTFFHYATCNVHISHMEEIHGY